MRPRKRQVVLQLVIFRHLKDWDVCISQCYACQAVWMASVVLVDIRGMTAGHVYYLTSFLYLLATMLVLWKLSPTQDIVLCRSNRFVYTINDKIRTITSFVEDSVRLASSISALCLDVSRILARAVFIEVADRRCCLVPSLNFFVILRMVSARV